MRTIYKYSVDPQLKLPATYEILHFASQNGQPTIWAEVDHEFPLVPTNLIVLPTGAEVPPNAQHLKTTIEHPFVWHLYQFI